MKKNMKLTEQIKRMKSLMTEERLYGNLVDNDKPEGLIIEQFGKLSGKLIDDIFTSAKGLDSAISLRYTKAAKLHNMSVKEYFKAFKDVPTDLSGFISHINKYEELVQDILIGSNSNTSITDLKKILGYLGKNVDVKDASGKVVGTAPFNMFDELSPGGPKAYEIIPTDGGLRLNAMENYRKTIGDVKFNEYLKGSDGVYAHPIVDNLEGVVKRIESGTLKGAYVVTDDVLETIISSKMYRNPKDKIIFTSEDSISTFLSSGAKDAMKNNELMVIMDSKTGELIPVKPLGANVDEILKATAETLSVKMKLKGALGWFWRQNFGGYLSIRVLSPKKIKAAYVKTWGGDGAQVSWGPGRLTMSYVLKLGLLSLETWGLCKLAQSTGAIGDPLPEWCTTKKHLEVLASGVLGLGAGVISLIDELLCDNIKTAKNSKTACQNFKDRVENSLNKLSNIGCDTIPWDTFPEDETQMKVKLNEFVVNKYISNINQISSDMGIGSVSGIEDFYIRAKSEFGGGNEDISKISNGLINKCLHEAESELSNDTKVIANQGATIISATGSGQAE